MVRIDVVTTRGGDGGDTSLGDGSRVRKQYVMMGNMVRGAGDKPCEKTAEQAVEPQALVSAEAARAAAAKKGLADRVKAKVTSLFSR